MERSLLGLKDGSLDGGAAASRFETSDYAGFCVLELRVLNLGGQDSGAPAQHSSWEEKSRSQRAQYPLIQEYTLNHNIITRLSPLSFKVYSFIEGYWAPWEAVA